MLQAGGAFKNRSWTIANVIIGGICFALLSCTVLRYALRSLTAYRLGKRWYVYHLPSAAALTSPV